jgi:hypothetical protein
MAESDIAAQFSAFIGAPVPYISEAVLVAGVMWIVSRSFARDTIEALRERLNLATDRLKGTSEEADNIYRQLEAARDLTENNDRYLQAERASAEIQKAARVMVTRNDQVLAKISTLASAGKDRVAPMSSGGPAARPDARK